MPFKLLSKVWKATPKSIRRGVTRLFETSFTVSAAAVVTNADGKVLLLDHLLRPASGWGLPGGFVNAGEQPDDAVKREVKEETGIDLANVRLLRVRTLKRHIEIIFTARGIGEPAVQSREITDARWFHVNEMPGEMALDQQFIVDQALRSDAS